MKLILFAVLFTTTTIISCDDKKSPADDEKTKGAKKTETTVGDVKDAKNDLEKLKEELEAMTPLTEDELKAKVPVGINGAERTDLNFSNSMGTAVANADYKINDSATLKLEIVDCGGPGGAGMFGAQYLNMIDVNSDDEDEYVKTIEFKGRKAFENCRKKKNKCTLAYFEGKRFLISLTGENISIGELKNIAKDLSF